MSFEKAKADLEEKGLGDHVIVLNESSATVAEAAHALGVEPASIAKTLSVLQGEKPVLIVTEGTAKLDNHKYKSLFHIKVCSHLSGMHPRVGTSCSYHCDISFQQSRQRLLQHLLHRHPIGLYLPSMIACAIIGKPNNISHHGCRWKLSRLAARLNILRWNFSSA